MAPNDPFLIARQPICDQRLRVIGYEILYRSMAPQPAGTKPGDEGTAMVAVSSILELGLDTVVGDTRAWINVTRRVLKENLYEFLPVDRVVLEVLEDIEADAEVVEALSRARTLGYRIALDDYVTDGRCAPLLELAHVVKLDVLQYPGEKLARAALSLGKGQHEVVAEKVETYEELDRAKAAGCTLFQGFFFAQPQVMSGRSLPADRLLLLRLLARLQDQDVDFEELEKLVSANVGLSYKLLRYVNSAGLGARTEIESISHAMVMLGLTRVRSCVTMLLLAGVQDKPRELVVTALVRARACEILGEKYGRADPHKHFSVGLLSMLDAFMNQHMKDLLDPVDLAKDMKAALLRREGTLGEILDLAVACERGDWKRLLSSPFGSLAMSEMWLEAIGWARATDAELLGSQ